ncbi:unnamed protein product [Rhizophagus irregularis]|nr:unnamed protein product [Rhizophagus irregularis]
MKQKANQRLKSYALQLINLYPLSRLLTTSFHQYPWKYINSFISKVESFKALISLFVLPFKMAYFINNFSFFLRKVSLFVCQIRELQCMNKRLISRDGVTWILKNAQQVICLRLIESSSFSK